METTTVIELFEELKKQIAALARRLDDRNPPAPPVSSIPTEPDNRLDRLLEMARHTHERRTGPHGTDGPDFGTGKETRAGARKMRCRGGPCRSAFAAAAYPHHRLQILEIDALHVRALARRRLLRRIYPSAARPHQQHVRRRTEIPIHQDERRSLLRADRRIGGYFRMEQGRRQNPPDEKECRTIRTNYSAENSSRRTNKIKGTGGRTIG